MFSFNFIFDSIFTFFSFILIIIHYHTQQLRKIKLEPMIKLDHNLKKYKTTKNSFVNISYINVPLSVRKRKLLFILVGTLII